MRQIDSSCGGSATTLSSPRNRAFHLLGALTLALVLFSGVSARVDSEGFVVVMHRALRLGGTEEWAREVRQRLGCDPCEEIRSVERSGEPVVYLFNPLGASGLARGDLVSASLLPIRRDDRTTKYMLVLILSDTGQAKIREYVGQDNYQMTVNEIAGERVGVTPLMISADQYVAATFQNEAAATTAAAALGVPTQEKEPV